MKNIVNRRTKPRPRLNNKPKVIHKSQAINNAKSNAIIIIDRVNASNQINNVLQSYRFLFE